MSSGVYIIILGSGETALAKIGFSKNVFSRLHSVCNQRRRDAILVVYFPRKTPKFEAKLHQQFADCAVGNECFLLTTALKAFIEANKLPQPIAKRYEKRAPHHSRRKTFPPIMTPDKIRRVGELLNAKITGPEVAKRLEISTASVYAFWRWSKRAGKFVRKQPKDRGAARAAAKVKKD